MLEGLCKPLLLRGHRRVCRVMEKSKGQQRGNDRDTNVLREEHSDKIHRVLDADVYLTHSYNDLLMEGNRLGRAA